MNRNLVCWNSALFSSMYLLYCFNEGLSNVDVLPQPNYARETKTKTEKMVEVSTLDYGHQTTYEPILSIQRQVSIDTLFRAIVPKDEVSITRVHFYASMETIESLIRLFPMNRQFIKFQDIFYDIKQHDHLVLAEKNMWLKKRLNGWTLRYVGAQFCVGTFSMLIFEDLFDTERIVRKLNDILSTDYHTLEEFERNLECVATIPTIRMSLETNSPLSIQLDTIQLSESRYTTIGTFTIRGGYEETESLALNKAIQLLDDQIHVPMCASKIIQRYQLSDPNMYRNLVEKNVVQYPISIEEDQISDRFAFGMPIQVGSETFIEMVKEAAKQCELYSDEVSDDYTDDEGSDSDEDKLK